MKRSGVGSIVFGSFLSEERSGRRRRSAVPIEVLVPLTASGLAVVSAVAGVIRLWLRLRYRRYVIDQAVAQGVTIDPVAVIEASKDGERRAPADAPSADPRP
jgi:hypothetical protein